MCWMFARRPPPGMQAMWSDKACRYMAKERESICMTRKSYWWSVLNPSKSRADQCTEWLSAGCRVRHPAVFLWCFAKPFPCCAVRLVIVLRAQRCYNKKIAGAGFSPANLSKGAWNQTMQNEHPVLGILGGILGDWGKWSGGWKLGGRWEWNTFPFWQLGRIFWKCKIPGGYKGFWKLHIVQKCKIFLG